MKPIRTAVLALNLTVGVASAVQFQPPIGIPDPAPRWGLLDPIRTDKPNTMTYCPGWHAGIPRDNTRALGDDRDAYYIDSSDLASTDSSNDYGRPTLPRKTIPNKIYKAGDYVEIHGDGATGTYKYSTIFDPRGVGSDSDPIWFVGVNSPILSAKMDAGSASATRRSYMVFDGIQWSDGALVDLRPRNANNGFDHFAFRNCEVKGTESTGQGTGFRIGASSTSDPSRTVSDIVLYKCEIHHFGNKNNPSEEHGVAPLPYATNIFILDSSIHDVAEDGIQAGHSAGRTVGPLYIGRNQIYNNLTNAIDLKGIGMAVISENTIYGHFDVWVGGVHKSTGQGESIVLHYSASSSGAGSWKQFPEDISILCNVIKDGRYGVATSRMGRLRIIGNTICNIHASPSGYSTKTEAIYLSGVKDDHWIANNTIFGCDGGIRIADGSNAYNSGRTYYRADNVNLSGKDYVCINDNADVGVLGVDPTNAAYWQTVNVQIWGNIIAGRTEATQSDIDFDSNNFATNNAKMDYNLVYNSSGEIYNYGNDSPRTLAWMVANTTHDDHSLNRDPILTKPESYDFTIQAASPAKDASSEGAAETAYDDYLNRFGLGIKVDRIGVTRPQGELWDIGAYEFVSSPPDAIPPVNTSLPTISGTPITRQTLTGELGNWSGVPIPNYAKQWLRCDSTGLNPVEIVGATDSSYVVQITDVGSTLRFKVTASNSAGATNATSLATAVATEKSKMGKPGSPKVEVLPN